MLRLLTVACLLAAAAAQRTYYCDSLGASPIRDSEFFLVTRNTGDLTYPPGLFCQFNADTETGFLLDIQAFRVSTAVLTISALGNIVFQGSVLPTYRKSIATTSAGYLKVTFNATGDYSRFSGVIIRVRAFSSNRCPPEWTLLYGSCIGTSNMTGRLNYVDAQKACNSMQANLLHIPVNWFGNLRNFMRSLPVSLRSYPTWVGLTDLTWRGQYTPYWLNGQVEYSTSEISCVSGGSYRTCYSYERCGAFYDRYESYAIYMDRCSDLDNYACSMRPGGDASFYTVPSGGSPIVLPSIIVPTLPPYRYRTNSGYSNRGVIWGSVAGCLFIVSLIVGGIYAAVRSKSRHTAGATGVIVTTGRVVAHPPQTAVHYLAQQQQQPSPPPYSQVPGAAGAPLYPAPPPPAYNVAVSGGYGNAAYAT